MLCEPAHSGTSVFMTLIFQLYAWNMSQEAKMEGFKLPVLSCICCPAFSTIGEITEDVHLVHFQFGGIHI